MNTNKKQKKILPEVHVLGDLQDAKNLVSGIKKKNTKVVFQDGEQGTYYTGTKKESKQILQEDLSKLENDHRLILFSFFPGQKKVEPLTEEIPDLQEPEKQKIQDEVKIKDRKGKKEKKNKHAKKEKKKK